jgi:hypothetical protein
VAVDKDFIVKNGLRVLSNTASSNTTTGALIVEGGAGIGGDLHLGGQIYVDGTVSIQATSNTDTFSIDNLDAIQFDTTSTITAGVGQLTWNSDAGTLDLGISDDVTLQIGQETHIHVKAAEAIADGDVVYASGAVGNSGQIEVSKFIADGTIEERRVVGIATESATTGEFFYVTSFGAIRGISTDGSALTVPEDWNLGDILYASPTVAGELTKTLPVAPNLAIAIAFVTSEHASNGSLMVRAYDLGYHLGEIHDVYINSVANNDILFYNGANSRWENSANASITVGDLGVNGDLSVTGNLTVSGNTTTVNTNELTIEDLNITLASGAANASAANGAGITIDGANAQMYYNSTYGTWSFNRELRLDNNKGIFWANANNSASLGIKTDTSDGLSFRVGGNWDRLYIAANSNVGVGTSTPSSKLDVNGLLTATNLNTGTANATTVNATTINATTLNGAFGNTAVSLGSSYPVTPTTGNMWFDNLNLKLKIFDGTNWQDAVPSGGGSSANSATTDANSTFTKYTYSISSATSVVSGQDVNSNTLSYDTSGIENIEVFVNGVKQVEGASYDYTATTGTSIGFTTSLSSGDVVDIQVYELLTNDAFVLKAGGAFEGTVEFTNTSISQTFTNSTLAHGMTLIAPTDQFLKVTREAAGGSGGVRFSALTDGSTAFNLSAYSTSPSTDGNNAVIRLRASKSNGSTSETTLADNEDVLTIGNTSTELFTVKGSGNIGIGGSSPDSKLYVNGDIRVTGVNNGSNKFGLIGVRRQDGTTALGGIGMHSTAGYENPIIYGYNAGSGYPDGAIRFSSITATDRNISTGLTDHMVINMYTGNVGVGTDLEPDYKLDVNGTGRFTDTLRVWDGANTSPETYMSWNAEGGLVGTGSNHDFNLRSNGTNRVTLDTSGHLYPRSTTQDLGTANNAWRNIYTQDLVLSNEARDSGNEVDGTKGNWTIQEGEDHLYIINNKNGKKYKFALEEIE